MAYSPSELFEAGEAFGLATVLADDLEFILQRIQTLQHELGLEREPIGNASLFEQRVSDVLHLVRFIGSAQYIQRLSRIEGGQSQPSFKGEVAAIAQVAEAVESVQTELRDLIYNAPAARTQQQCFGVFDNARKSLFKISTSLGVDAEACRKKRNDIRTILQFDPPNNP